MTGESKMGNLPSRDSDSQEGECEAGGARSDASSQNPKDESTSGTDDSDNSNDSDGAEEAEALAASEQLEHDERITFEDDRSVPDGFDSYFNPSPRTYTRHLRHVSDLAPTGRFLCGRIMQPDAVPGGSLVQPLCKQCLRSAT